MQEPAQICFNCDGVMMTGMYHNCFRGITENINNLRNEMKDYVKTRKDHLDGLKYALEIIEHVEHSYRAMGCYPCNPYERDPINDIINAIRMRLGIKLIPRPI